MSVDDRLRAGLNANATAFDPAVESSLDAVRARGRRGRGARVAVAAGLIAAASAVVLVLAWPDASPPPRPATPVPSPTSELFGRYESDVTQPNRLAGHWVLEFNGNGTVLVTPPGRYAGVVSGTLFTADGTTLRTNLFAQDVCADLGNGEFTWTREGARLALAEYDEPCAPRARFFTGNAWVAVSEQ
jgi:hypothetical protein